jgi:hypothetical protein
MLFSPGGSRRVLPDGLNPVKMVKPLVVSF